MTAPLKAPFPWFGGKSRVSHLVWNAFGDVANYVEPFAGSLAVLLGRPHEPRIETVNDLDCYLANFWRAVQYAPEEVARWADWPVSEIDLHARHRWLVAQTEFREAMRSNPEHFDARVAGWWVWGICQWIGGGWCADSNWSTSVPSPRGKNRANEKTRPKLHSVGGVHKRDTRGSSAGWNKRPDISKGGRGVHTAKPSAQWEQMPVLGGSRGAANRGVNASALHRKLPMLSGKSGNAGRGVNASGQKNGPLALWMFALAERLRRVRICCGNWNRVVGSRSVTEKIGVTGVFLDPPYLADFRDPSLYGTESADVAHEVREWAIKNGNNKKMRIALCGYEGEHQMPDDWQCVSWKAAGGYAAAAGNTENSTKERIWFSPHCARAHDQADLFVGGAA